MKKQLMLLVGLMLVLSVFLAACTGKDNVEGVKEPEKQERNETSRKTRRRAG